MKEHKHSSHNAFHEELNRATIDERGTDQQFGFVFGVVFAIIAFVLMLRGHSFWVGVLALSGSFVLSALLVPGVFRWPNHIWLAFGEFLHRLTQPLILGLLFYFSIVPVGVILRIIGKDPLALKFDQQANSYWISRSDDEGGSMLNQF